MKPALGSDRSRMSINTFTKTIQKEMSYGVNGNQKKLRHFDLLKMKKRSYVVVGFLCLAAGATTVEAQEREKQPQDVEALEALSLEQLMNLEVTVASKEAEKISDAAGVISVVRKEDIERFGGITLRDILERVPSLTRFASSSTEGYGLASRGDQVKETSGHILILINGRPTRETLEGGISSETFAAFPVNIIERIEVIRGPGSVLYGSNAFSAVINIVTIEEESSNVAVSALTGLDGEAGANVQGTVRAGDLSIVLGGRYLDKGDRNIDYTATSGGGPGGGTTTTSEEQMSLTDETKSGFMAVKYKNFSLNSNYNDYDAKVFNGGSMNNWTKWFNNLGYNMDVSENWDMEFNLTYTHATFDGDGIGVQRKSNDLVGEWTNHINLGGSSRLIVGGLYNYLKGSELQTSSDEYISKGDRSIFALYAQADVWVIESLKLIGGFQANKIPDHDLSVVPRVGAVWYPVKRLNVKALYAQAFRTPSINELKLDHDGRQGNDDLDPEMVTSYDFGVNYQGEKFSVGVNYFINNQKDIIALDNNTYENLSKIDFQGFEFEGRYYVTKELYLMGSFLNQTSKDGDGTEDTTPIAINSFKGGVSYAWEKGITISLFDIYSGDLGDVYGSSTGTGMGASSSTPAPGSYNQLNLYASFDLVKLINMNTKHQLSVFVQGNDMLDEEIWIPAVGSSQYTSTVPDMPGRAVYIGLKASLK